MCNGLVGWNRRCLTSTIIIYIKIHTTNVFSTAILVKNWNESPSYNIPYNIHDGMLLINIINVAPQSEAAKLFHW